MTNPIDITGAKPRYETSGPPYVAPPRSLSENARPRFDPYTGEPITLDTPEHERIQEQFTKPEEFPKQQAPQDIPQVESPVNPYAPTGWKRKYRVEFDLDTPSGQHCRVMRLEREDLFRMNLLQYLDTFTPMLMDGAVGSEAEQNRKVKEALKDNPDALSNMFMAIDQVVMAATIKPKVTDDEEKADYGTEVDWRNPRFMPTAYINDIALEDRMAIFGAAFGRSMDDLKSVFAETPGLGSMADESVVQSPAE